MKFDMNLRMKYLGVFILGKAKTIKDKEEYRLCLEMKQKK